MPNFLAYKLRDFARPLRGAHEHQTFIESPRVHPRDPQTTSGWRTNPGTRGGLRSARCAERVIRFTGHGGQCLTEGYRDLEGFCPYHFKVHRGLIKRPSEEGTAYQRAQRRRRAEEKADAGTGHTDVTNA